MKSGTSSSKGWFYPTLWKKNMLRFWPIWALYLACWTIAMPLELLNSFRYSGPNFAAVTVRELCTWPALLAAGVFGILSAMAVFSYLYDSRSAGMIHALPVRREGLFLTNYLSGLSFLILPQLAVVLLTLLAEVALGCVDGAALGAWLTVQVCDSLFFYSFAVFCAMFTGHILALPAFYTILNGLAAGLYFLLSRLCDALLFGFAGIAGLSRVALWLTPVAKLYSSLRVDIQRADDGTLELVRLIGLGYPILYALVGLVLAGLALVLYRRRHLEGAGEVVTVRWVRPIFKYGVAFCAALALGTLLHLWLFGNPGQHGVWLLLAAMLPCGVAGYFAAEILLKKSFHVLARGWKGCLAFSLALAGLALCVDWDLIGYQSRVPDPNQVLDVEISNLYSRPGDSGRYDGFFTADRNTIRAVTAFHQSVVDRRVQYQNASLGGYFTTGVVDGLEVDDLQQEEVVSFQLIYTTAGGGEIRRRYDIPVRAEDLSDPDSPGAQLTALLNRQNRVDRYFPPELMETGRLVEISLEVETWVDDTINNERLPIAQGREADLLAAVREDLAAGRLGTRYLLQDGEMLSHCYLNVLRFTFAQPRPEVPGSDINGDLGPSYSTVAVALQTTATSTLSLLEELGYPDSSLLVTQLQRQHEYWQRYQEEKEDPALWEEYRAVD